MSFINIEIKARCFHPEKVEASLLNAGARYLGIDHQIDTYFNVPNGRLKLREGNIEKSLIYYERPNQAVPKASTFKLIKLTETASMKDLMSVALGVLKIVEKKRKIFYIDNVKFHLDEVPNLGNFVEIEAGNIINPNLTTADLQEQCNHYLQQFNIQLSDLIENSYSDMLMDKS